MYTLYHYPYSQHARRVVALFEEADIEYNLKHIAMDKNEHASKEYASINPNEQVPTLIDGDLKIHESNAILRYVCTKHGLSEWYPEDLEIRANVEQWLDWNQCRFSPAVVDIVLNKVFMGEHGDKLAIKRGEENMRNLIPILDKKLEHDKYLAGDNPTIADISVASNIFQLSLAEAQPTESNIDTWYQRISQRTGFIKSLPQ